METSNTATEPTQRSGLRDRLKQVNPAMALSVETLETLSNLADTLTGTANRISRELKLTTELIALKLDEASAEIRRSETEATNTMQRLAEEQRALTETERNLAYAVERLRRHSEHVVLMHTGVIVLALMAGVLGGTAAALLILGLMW